MSAQQLLEKLQRFFPETMASYEIVCDQLIVTVSPDRYRDFCLRCRDHAELSFECLMDLCGVDYLTYAHQETVQPAKRFAVVVQLLSLSQSTRLRIKTFCSDNDRPCVDSLISVYPNADWFEREAFDLFGIVFDGHTDLRRILTDYGFVGHPFRKDFPISGYVELSYDQELGRIVQKPVSIEAREIVPRVIREEHYATNELPQKKGS